MRALIAMALLAGLAACGDHEPKPTPTETVVPVPDNTTNPNDECPRADGQPCR